MSRAGDLLSRALGKARPRITLYRGYGRAGRVWVGGRVLADTQPGPTEPHAPRWKNLVAMLRRIDADPVPGAVVAVRCGPSEHVCTADDEGFFGAWINAPTPERVNAHWITVHADLVAPHVRGEGVRATTSALVPATDPALLVISDVDDTVLQSNVGSTLAALRTMLLENARTRLPFPGVAAFYRALREGAKGGAGNPVFYVSSSPWNLHDVITEFLHAQDIPEGPLLLRDVDIGLDVFTSHHHHTHKRAMVRDILTTFSGVPTILIGDSGQQDPEIYRAVVEEFPGRILAVYIRNVSPELARTDAVRALAREVESAGSTLILADDTIAAATHAAEQGWIAREALAEIRAEKRADSAPTASATAERDAR